MQNTSELKPFTLESDARLTSAAGMGGMNLYPHFNVSMMRSGERFRAVQAKSIKQANGAASYLIEKGWAGVAIDISYHPNH